ncbi:MAG: GNAT family N-acetyltransferase [Tidjanibacter sp.]|nr:GNAT family N-acetyltransferase [Tidjanibacter sp.]
MTTSTINIAPLREATTEIATCLEGLMSHLMPGERPEMDVERLRAIIDNPHSVLFVAWRGEEIVGALTALHYTAPVSDKVWIEDVVVAPSARGFGIGRGLVKAALEWGGAHFPTAKFYLTSNPTRTVARALYTSMGFEEYNTGVFRLMKTIQ